MNEFDRFLKELRDSLLSGQVVKQDEVENVCKAARDLFLYSGWFVKETV